MRIYIHVHWIIHHMPQIKDFQINISVVHFSKNRIKTLEATNCFNFFSISWEGENKISNLFRKEVHDIFKSTL